jgi:putative DNA primase/helicase
VGEEHAHLSDTGNAQRFRLRHGQDVRYCDPWSKWLTWDGRRWKVDDTQAVKALAKETVLSLFAWASGEVAELGRRLEAAGEGERGGVKGDLARVQRVLAWALKSEAAPRINALLDLARSEEGVPVLPDALDAAPWLLNVPNGTLDLRTGQLRGHRRADMITKLCPVPYDPGAACPRWERFLNAVFAHNEALVGYVQKLLGYALTGDVREQLLAVFWGLGANGKSTLINTVLELLGEDYAVKASRDLFLARKQDNHPAQLARLFGKRLVVAVETQEGARLDEALVKELTGGDPITARRMREDPWQFNPTHKAVLVTNHKPEIRGTDHGIWRRLRLVAFTVRVPDKEQDKLLPERLRAELPGILAWCVRGCQKWQKEGLKPPAEVRAATQAYRDEQDVLGEFLAECCDRHPELRVKASTLYAAFKAWGERRGERPVTQRAFGQAMSEREFQRRESHGVWYAGVALRQVSEADPG